MKRIFPQLRISLNAPLLRGLHLGAYGLFPFQGYRWELRRAGDLKLGLWRKTLKKNGKKPPVPKRFVFVPGFGDTPLSWMPVLQLIQPLIKDEFDELVLMDFPGFGGFLSREKSFHSMDLLVSAVQDAFDSLKPHTIVGHSLGGWLTALYAADCGDGKRPKSKSSKYSGPERIVVVSPAGAFTDEKTREEWGQKFTAATQKGFESLRPHIFGKEPYWFRFIAHEFSKFITREDIVQFVGSVRQDHMLDELLPKIQCKTWLLWGELDSLIPSACLEVWVKQLNPEKCRPRGILLKDTGHSPQLEHPAVTAAALSQVFTESRSRLLPDLAGLVGNSRWWSVVSAERSSSPG